MPCPCPVYPLSIPCPSPVRALSIPCPSPVHALSMPCPSPVHALSIPCPCPVHPLSIPCPCPVHPPSIPCPCPVPWPLAPGRLSVSPRVPVPGDVPSEGHPVSVLPVSCPTGGFLCLTTRSNPSNLRYKAELEAALGQLERSGAWQKLLAQEVEYWERATSEEESTRGNGYISGIVYIYQKCPVPHLEED
ncbi:formin-2-like [Cyanistes caeruleus]|uniref:formin-2-like n=1 Tax=Cyanistes caeruleus TaxID=156563 RepID=UPI000CDAFBA6|nr:formin-2-like [Cyanistes caeruleus]